MENGLESTLAAYTAAATQLAAARTHAKQSSANLFASLSAVASRHAKEIGELFSELGYSDLYEERFGSAYGSYLAGLARSANGHVLICTFGSYFRGEPQEDTFRLPVKYVTGDIDKLIAQDLVHYRRALTRLRAWEERPDPSAADEVATYLRLQEQFKDVPQSELIAAAAASQP